MDTKHTLTGGDPVDRLVDEFVARRIDRRELFRRAAALGLSVGAAGALVETAEASSRNVAATKVLRYGFPISQSNYNLDPAIYVANSRSRFADGVFEGLVQYDPRASSPKLQMVLAEKLDVSKDGRRIGFTLRKGVQFHHGFGEVTADDVKYSFERIAGIQKLYPDATSKDSATYPSEWEQLERVQVTGKYSGVIRLKKPFVPLLSVVLPYSNNGIVASRKAIEKYGRTGTPTQMVGTGPYQAAPETDKLLVLTRSKSWHAHWNRPVFWDEIRYILASVVQGQPSTLPLEAGEVDLIPDVQVVDYLRLKGNPKFRTFAPVSLAWNHIMVNPQYPTLRDGRVRLAIRSAIDVPALMKLANVSPDKRAWAIQAQGWGGGYWKDAPHWDRDLDRSKTLLQQAGVSGLEVTLADYFPVKGQAEVVQANLADAGIKVNILSGQAIPSNYVTDPKVGQLTGIVFGGAPDPWEQFSSYTCDQIGVYNWAFWCNYQFDKHQLELGYSQDPKLRQRDSIYMQKLMERSAAFIWLYYPTRFYVTSTKVKKAAFSLNGQPYPSFFEPA